MAEPKLVCTAANQEQGDGREREETSTRRFSFGVEASGSGPAEGGEELTGTAARICCCSSDSVAVGPTGPGFGRPHLCAFD